MVPFLKWPGGKRWLMTKFGHYFPQSFNRYFEPFLGGAAGFFFLNPSRSTISDINVELVNLYHVMRDSPVALAQAMQIHQKLHDKNYYYSIRNADYDDPIKVASRFLYLNRTCFNGMYRVNSAGQFNVPIGTKQNCIFDIAQFPVYATRLKNANIISCDFEDTINECGLNDLVFADPPYTLSHSQNSFIKYNEHLFTWADQNRLLKSLCSARSRGAIIIATNANYEPLKKMYTDSGFYVKVLKRFSVISGKAEKRQKQEELLISSFAFDGDV
jgi:DNA adenine methylase